MCGHKYNCTLFATAFQFDKELCVWYDFSNHLYCISFDQSIALLKSMHIIFIHILFTFPCSVKFLNV